MRRRGGKLMDYALRREESTSDGIVRIAREQLERALLELSTSAEVPDAHVHSLRKRLKKLRGLLRLVEGPLGKGGFRVENACYRDAAHRLATARRAAATIGSFDALLAHYPGELAPDAAQALRELLVAERDRALGSLHEESHAAEVSALLRDALVRVDSWPLEVTGDWSELGPGFRDAYARARRALSRARETPNTIHFHEWRKWAKYHWYHVRLLKRVWPAVLKPVEVALEDLTESLGNEHDLDDLRLALIERPAPPELAAGLGHALALIARRRDELRESALSLGARVFAERPGACERRFRRYFEAWHREVPIAPHHADEDDDA